MSTAEEMTAGQFGGRRTGAELMSVETEAGQGILEQAQEHLRNTRAEAAELLGTVRARAALSTPRVGAASPRPRPHAEAGPARVPDDVGRRAAETLERAHDLLARAQAPTGVGRPQRLEGDDRVTKDALARQLDGVKTQINQLRAELEANLTRASTLLQTLGLASRAVSVAISGVDPPKDEPPGPVRLSPSQDQLRPPGRQRVAPAGGSHDAFAPRRQDVDPVATSGPGDTSAHQPIIGSRGHHHAGLPTPPRVFKDGPPSTAKTGFRTKVNARPFTLFRAKRPPAGESPRPSLAEAPVLRSGQGRDDVADRRPEAAPEGGHREGLSMPPDDA